MMERKRDLKHWKKNDDRRKGKRKEGKKVDISKEYATGGRTRD